MSDALYPKLLEVLSNPRFLSGAAAGAETPFYICPYAIKDQDQMTDVVSSLARKLEEGNVKVLAIDLFALMIDVLKRNDDLEWTLEHEPEQDFATMREDLHSVLDEETIIAPEIAVRVHASNPQVVFLENIGACYPVLRAHKLLNNLPSAVGRIPLVLFFPGEYRQIPGTGATLSLFGRLKGDGYYRAFNILEAQV